MTFADWKAALIPLGWVEVGGRLMAPLGAQRVMIVVIDNKRTDLCNFEPLKKPLNEYEGHIRINTPPNLDTMRALMTGLQIPIHNTKIQGDAENEH